MLIRQLFDLESSTYTYLLADFTTNEGVIIDPVDTQLKRDLQLIEELGIQLKYILETHVHADHVTSSWQLKKSTGAKIVLGAGVQGQVECADLFLSDGEKVDIGNIAIQAISTPGHTNGCTSYFVDEKVFTGDTLLIRGCGRTDFQEGSSEKLFESVQNKLFKLPDGTLVYPAHDYHGFTVSSIGEEKSYNPRLKKGTPLKRFIEIMESLNLEYPKKIEVAVPANFKCGQS